MARRYDSTRRQAQARATRLRIIEAATDLFVTHGYAATSIAAIADAADVAPQTIYAAFGTKAGLLGAAVDVAMAGDDEPIAIIDRPDQQAVLATDDPAAYLAGGVGQVIVGEGEETLLALCRALLDDDPAARQRFLGRHPEARGYADFKDFAFYRLVIGGGHLVAGFGRIVDLDRKDLVEGNVGGGASEEDRQAG